MRSRNLKLLASTALVTSLSITAANSDEVINDDLIVLGSECIGIDCFNGFNFGFDTLVLRENNLRIKFEDTSTSASFPTTDWRIIINDSANGGQNYFAVEDITANTIPFRIRGSAPSNSLYVDQQGDVGLGTDNPVLELHIVDGDTPSVRLDQNGSSGWTPQVWDVAGNETNFFIRDVTNGSALPFRIIPGANTNSMRIENDGDIGIGVTSAQTKVHIAGGDGTLRITDTEANAADKRGFLVSGHYTSGEEELLGMEISARQNLNIISIGGGNSAYNAASLLRFYTAGDETTTTGTERMRVLSNGKVAIARTNVGGGNIFEVGTDTTNGNGAFLTNAGVWTDASSRTNKMNITNLSASAAVEAIKNMQPITYQGKQDPTAETYVGFIAEEVPDLVAMNSRKGIAAIEVSAVLTSVVKEHQATIEFQNEKIQLLEEKLATLEALIIGSNKN